MRRMTVCTAAIGALALASLLCLPPDARALLQPADVDGLTRAAVTIVTGEVTAVRSFRSADPSPLPGYSGSILTDVHLRVCSVLKGDAGPRLVVTVPGGTVGRESITSPDAPDFLTGGSYLVFLDAEGGVEGWRRGRLQVVAGRVVDLDRPLSTTATRIARLTGQQPRRLAPLAEDEAPASAASGRDTAPVIESITPGAAPAGTGAAVTIRGSGFGSEPGDVFFFYRSGERLVAADVKAWADTGIRCLVPTGTIDGYDGSAASGPVYVRRADGTSSNGFDFSVTFAFDGAQWPRSRCPYRIAGTLDKEWRMAVRAAALTWDRASGRRFRFVYRGSFRRATVVQGDGLNTVGGSADLPQDTVAVTWDRSIGGAVIESDLVFNMRHRWSTTGETDAMDVRTVALHELGHWLGLLDLYGDADAHKTMYGLLANGQVKRRPADEDVQGARWIYSGRRRDRRRPVTRARRETVRHGGTARFSFLVKDARHSCGAARLRIVVRDAARRKVLTVRCGVVPTNQWTDVAVPGITLPRGRYLWQVFATDLAGHKQVRAGSGRLIVR